MPRTSRDSFIVRVPNTGAEIEIYTTKSGSVVIPSLSELDLSEPDNVAAIENLIRMAKSASFVVGSDGEKFATVAVPAGQEQQQQPTQPPPPQGQPSPYVPREEFQRTIQQLMQQIQMLQQQNAQLMQGGQSPAQMPPPPQPQAQAQASGPVPQGPGGHVPDMTGPHQHGRGQGPGEGLAQGRGISALLGQ